MVSSVSLPPCPVSFVVEKGSRDSAPGFCFAGCYKLQLFPCSHLTYIYNHWVRSSVGIFQSFFKPFFPKKLLFEKLPMSMIDPFKLNTHIISEWLYCIGIVKNVKLTIMYLITMFATHKHSAGLSVFLPIGGLCRVATYTLKACDECKTGVFFLIHILLFTILFFNRP